MITRAQWRAKFGTGHPTAGAKLEFYVHHSAAALPERGAEATSAAEAAEVRRIEAYHAVHLTPTNPRIGYTFLVAMSGRTYVGTGWGRVGAHTKNRNSSAYAVCLLGDYRKTDPTQAQLDAIARIREEGVRLGHLHRDHAVRGHRDVVATSCPGDRAYRVIVKGVPSTPPVVEGAAAAAVMPTLRLGKGGRNAPAAEREAVRELQRRLGQPDRYRTGYFGEVTDRAVRAYQFERGLVVDGIVGPVTWRQLGA